MKCPHCLTFFHNVDQSHLLDGGPWSVIWRTCPACDKIIIDIESGYSPSTRSSGTKFPSVGTILCYPRAAARVAISPEVPSKYGKEYAEAFLTMADSPRASAALSRHCLQALLRDCAAVTPSTLGGEIQEVLYAKNLPTHLNEYLEALTIIGNFATHPGKSTHCGELAPVESGEPEWNLEVLEALFDHYFVQPELIQQKRGDLITRLASVGKAQQAPADRNPPPHR